MKDFQRSKVYAWENKFARTNDKVEFEQAQSIVNYVWEKEGLKYPPIVQPQNITDMAGGSANRNHIFLPAMTNTGIILHEIAHSMTCTTFNGLDDVEYIQHSHNEVFVGVYMKLLDKYARIPLPVLMYTAKEAGVKFDIHATSSLLDK